MRAGLGSFAAATAIAQMVAAQPHHIHHAHLHKERDVVTEIDYVTASGPAVVVIVDQNGNPISTSSVQQATPIAQAYGAPPAAEPTPTSAPPAYTPSPPPLPSPPSYALPAPPPASASSPPPPPSSPPAQPATSSPSAYAAPPLSPTSAASPPPPPPPPNGSSSSGSNAPSGNGLGIVYAAYHDDGSCKDSNAVNQDFQVINGFSKVRIEGTDCNQVSNVLSVCKEKGMKLFTGVYNIDNVASEMQTIISAVGNDWDLIDTVSVGNEVVNQQGAGALPKVIAGLGTARSLLKATPYKGPVVAVDTFDAVEAHPEICQNSDYAAVNAYAFFDSTTSPSGAGPWAKKTASDVSNACGGKKTVITESGSPSSGGSDGTEVPSPRNQQTAISSLKSSFSSDLFLMGAFNDKWKKNGGGQFGCENFYGIYGDSPTH